MELGLLLHCRHTCNKHRLVRGRRHEEKHEWMLGRSRTDRKLDTRRNRKKDGREGGLQTVEAAPRWINNVLHSPEYRRKQNAGCRRKTQNNSTELKTEERKIMAR